MVNQITKAIISGNDGIFPRISGVYICECCLKRPETFKSKKELTHVLSFLLYSPYILPTNISVNLRMHIKEKPFKYIFYYSRFKNKNKAKRHKNLFISDVIYGLMRLSRAMRLLFIP